MREIGGFLFPDHDRDCSRAVFGELPKLREVAALATDFSACVQAGGNVGVFARELAARFGTVYVAEPSAENFACLARNCEGQPNVIKLQCALGFAGQAPVAITASTGNCGAHQVRGYGAIPVLAIDSLGLSRCGLIYLDVEGYEYPAVVGARETILSGRPVLALEMKGLGIARGWTDEALEEYVLALGYRRVAGRFGSDRVYVPQ